MPLLFELLEWRLIQELKYQLVEKRARYQPQISSLIDFDQIPAETFEVELAYLFTIEDPAQDIDPVTFGICQTNLTTLCTLLESLVQSRRGYEICQEGQTYPRLYAVTKLLESSSTSKSFGLAIGPNQTLFRLPTNPQELSDGLHILTECSRKLRQLTCSPSRDTTGLSVHVPKVARWKRVRSQNHAISVLKILLKHFKCGISHEVLLELAEDLDEKSKSPSLRLMLSSCPELQIWQEAYCVYKNLDEARIPEISDICADVQQHIGLGYALTLLVREYGIFGTWLSTHDREASSASRESLNQLIINGSFRPLTVKSRNNVSRVKVREKRALALKLGFCLMDYFQANLTASRIYFTSTTQTNPWEQLPYLAFSSNLAAPIDPYKFEWGHSILLSFAKLLLEIHFGEPIDLEINSDSRQNHEAWFSLLRYVEELDSECPGSYLEAIRGCLSAHTAITRALDSDDAESSDVDLIIRKELYDTVVYKLELALAETKPRSSNKRQRSESPPPEPYGVDESSVPPISKIATRASHSVDRPMIPKKRRTEAMLDTSSSISSRQSSHPLYQDQSQATAMESAKLKSRNGFQVAIICALPLEYDAVSYIFDAKENEYGRAGSDRNNYTTGRIDEHGVIMTLLPGMGKVNAASAAASMRSSFGGLHLVLVVGVCGAVPHAQRREILLGDVIISRTLHQYDLGRKYAHKFVSKTTIEDNFPRLTNELRSLLAMFQTDLGSDQLEECTSEYLVQLQRKLDLTQRRGKYQYPGAAADKLYKSSYRHKHQPRRKEPETLFLRRSTNTSESQRSISDFQPSYACRDCLSDSDAVCESAITLSCEDLGCDDEYLVPRKRLQPLQQKEPYNPGAQMQPQIHLGAVASGDMVMKSSADRDRLAQETGVLAFDMEGAGVWDEFPCIVIKGVCDYADSHKNKGWQNYAAATAAAAAKAVLERYFRSKT